MASISKRGRYWYVHYRVHGQLVQRSLKTTSKRIAAQKLTQIQHELDAGRLGLVRKPTATPIAFEAFLREVVAKKSPPWAKRMEQLLRPYRAWCGKRPENVMEVPAAAIEAFLERRSQEVAPKTLNDELGLIRRFYRWAQQRDYLVRNPAEHIDRLTVRPKPIRIFTPEELRLIFRHASETIRPFFQMLLYTGLRLGELRNLEWADVDLDRHSLRVRIKQDWIPKTRHERTVPLSAEAYTLLRGLPHRSGYVFLTKTGKRRYGPWWHFTRALNHIKKAEGIDLTGQVSPHTFRHTFATVCLMQGVDIKTVSEFLGHTSIKMTEKYLHLVPDYKAQQMKRVRFISATESDPS